MFQKSNKLTLFFFYTTIRRCVTKHVDGRIKKSNLRVIVLTIQFRIKISKTTYNGLSGISLIWLNL